MLRWFKFMDVSVFCLVFPFAFSVAITSFDQIGYENASVFLLKDLHEPLTFINLRLRRLMVCILIFQQTVFATR